MTTPHKTLLQQALNALKSIPTSFGNVAYTEQVTHAIAALQDAIDAPESEPVAWISDESYSRLKKGGNDSKGTVPIHAKKSWASTTALYLHPPTVRDPLTDKRISQLWRDAHNDTTDRMEFQVFARNIEAAHGIGWKEQTTTKELK